MIAALPHDNAALRLNVATWVLTSVSLIFLALRVYCKLFRTRKLWWDDFILIAAWVRLIMFSPLARWKAPVG